MSRQTTDDRRQHSHTIRLRGPWLLADGGRVKLPAVWRDALGDADRVTLTRSFNRPTGLEASGTQVLLRVTSEHAIDKVRLNGAELAEGIDLVELLTPSNRLSVSLSRHSPNAPLLEAWLEIVE